MNYEDLTWEELLNLPPKEQGKIPREVYDKAYWKKYSNGEILKFTTVIVE